MLPQPPMPKDVVDWLDGKDDVRRKWRRALQDKNIGIRNANEVRKRWAGIVRRAKGEVGEIVDGANRGTAWRMHFGYRESPYPIPHGQTIFRRRRPTRPGGGGLLVATQ